MATVCCAVFVFSVLFPPVSSALFLLIPNPTNFFRPLLGFILAGFFLSGCGPAAYHYNQLGAEDVGRKDLQGARQEFERAVFWDGGNPVFHNNLGYDLYLLKDYDGAEEQFRKALSDSPDDNLIRQIKINQALLYCDGTADLSKARKGWNAKGIAVLRELLAKDENNAEFHMRLGFAYFQASNPGGGFNELDKAVHLATPSLVAHYTRNAAEGSLLILRNVQQFYTQIHLFKKSREIQSQINRIENRSKNPAGKISNVAEKVIK